MYSLFTLRSNSSRLPDSPGVYLFKSSRLKTLYIGKAKNLKKRVKSYFLEKHLVGKTKLMMEKAAFLDFVLVDSELEALLLEAALIKKYKPSYNTVSRDDKSPLFIYITSETYPRLRTGRLPQVKQYKSLKPGNVFGPFPSGSSARIVLRRIRHIFPFCESKGDKGRPCAYSHISLCHPCPRSLTQNPDPAAAQIYKNNISRIRQVLKGKIHEVVKLLRSEMDKAANKDQFEKAAKLRDQIRKLTLLTQHSRNIEEYLTNPNLVQDQAEASVASLATALNLPQYPQRIECFDIANLKRDSATASMVVARSGLISHIDYKHFKIKSITLPNDAGAIKEVVSRRLGHPEWGTPDLIVVDGGIPQLNSAVKAVKTHPLNHIYAQTRIISLAKRLEGIYLPQNNTPLLLSRDHPGLKLLVSLRNEAHRFSRRLHHHLRSNSLFS